MIPNIFGLLPVELEKLIEEWGEKKYRSKQIFDWIYNKKINQIDLMKNLPATLRAKLDETIAFKLPEIELVQKSIDGTRKYLLKLEDNSFIEMVIIPTDTKNTLCVSSQVGCSRGCAFCATAGLGLKRNLSVAEITGQVYLAIKELKDKRLTNLVFMGMGEPLDNYDNVIKAIEILQQEMCFSFSPRRITVSTCGVVPGIEKLAKSKIKLKLAVSLNAALDDKRSALMPVTKTYPLALLKKTLLDFRKSNPYRITFEYVLIKNLNMEKSDQKALRKFVGDISSKLNFIIWNRVEGLPWETPTQEEVDVFIKGLEDLSVAITFRKSRGSDIAAACGQLAAQK